MSQSKNRDFFIIKKENGEKRYEMKSSKIANRIAARGREWRNEAISNREKGRFLRIENDKNG